MIVDRLDFLKEQKKLLLMEFASIQDRLKYIENEIEKILGEG
jgi:vacuolar-type H+-ATPase subunit D/Vma8